MATLERISADAWAPIWTRHQHLARYEWARQFVSGASCVDAACGTGYGTKILADAGAAQVVGFDVCPETVEEATRTYAIRGIAFETASVTSLPAESASVDVYACFETIEHVVDDEGLLREAARVLKPGGTFLCSSPNRALTNPGTKLSDKPFNEHHVREYTPEEFHELLERFFPSTRLYGQTFFSSAWKGCLGAAAGFHRKMAVRMHQVRKLLGTPLETRQRHEPQPLSAYSSAPEFLVAVCQRN